MEKLHLQLRYMNFQFTLLQQSAPDEEAALLQNPHAAELVNFCLLDDYEQVVKVFVEGLRKTKPRTPSSKNVGSTTGREGPTSSAEHQAAAAAQPLSAPSAAPGSAKSKFLSKAKAVSAGAAAGSGPRPLG
ncbi:unnamed protein product, partial [Amoebophrya sp. A120]|eukprot:GSA120T00026322001.1